MTDTYAAPADDHDGYLDEFRPAVFRRVVELLEAEHGLPSAEWEGPPWPING